MTPVVVDASAGVELMAGTKTGRALRVLLPPEPVLWAPETIYMEVGAVLRRWDLNRVLTPEQIEKAIRRLPPGLCEWLRCGASSQTPGGTGTI